MDNKIDKISIGKRIKELREKKKEFQKDLAHKISASPDSISKIENGVMALTLENAILISEHYKVSLDYICKGEGGANLLDTLNKYISLNYQKNTGITGDDKDDTAYPLPVLSINKAYFDYLLQTANANATDNIPEPVKKQWIEIETQKFNENIIHHNYQEVASVVPVKESIVLKNPDLHITISNSKLNDI